MLIDIYRRDLFCTIMHGGRAFFPWMGDIGTNLILAPPPRTTAIYGCGGGRRKGERRLFLFAREEEEHIFWKFQSWAFQCPGEEWDAFYRSICSGIPSSPSSPEGF